MMDHSFPSSPPAAAVLDSLINPVLVVSKTNGVSYANAAAEDFFQTSAAQLRKLTLQELLPFASPALAAVEACRQDSAVIQEYGVTLGTPRTGGERQVDIQVAPMVDPPGYVVVTLLRRSVAQKIDLQLTHRGAARAVASMAAMLAHEVKNPLAGIRGAAQLLEPALVGEDRALARLICEETDRIRDLLDRMEVFSDERPLERQPVNIHVVLGRVKQLVKAASPDALSFREEYDPSLPPVFGNHDQLVQVFLNLVKNAAEAMENEAGQHRIVLRTAFKPGIKLSVPGQAERVSLPLEVCVQDEGSGIPEDLRPHVFDAFVTSKPHGKGLGLALVAKIVRDHGGVVECLPRDRGTTFRVLLPMHRDEGSDRPGDGDMNA